MATQNIDQKWKNKKKQNANNTKSETKTDAWKNAPKQKHTTQRPILQHQSTISQTAQANTYTTPPVTRKDNGDNFQTVQANK